MRKKKGFTLIELLVVIAVIAMLLAILMPALNKVKKLAKRLVCGTNTKGMGTAISVYGFDYRDAAPVQGGKTGATWGFYPDQDPATTKWFDTMKNWGTASGGTVSVAASLYLLVIEADVAPKSFLCPGSDEVEFKTSDPIHDLAAGVELTEVWDFGANPALYCSYSYQQPYNASGSTSGVTINLANMAAASAQALIADRNPWCDENLTQVAKGAADEDYKTQVGRIDWGEKTGNQQMENSSSDKKVQMGNSAAHDREGQNVLYTDGHSEFQRRPDCGLNDDNIYTSKMIPTDGNPNRWRTGNGMAPLATAGYSSSQSDAVLVSDEECEM
jgi:prepilin-type N-terminal cleavage/methylation domain-containing protein